VIIQDENWMRAPPWCGERSLAGYLVIRQVRCVLLHLQYHSQAGSSGIGLHDWLASTLFSSTGEVRSLICIDSLRLAYIYTYAHISRHLNVIIVLIYVLLYRRRRKNWLLFVFSSDKIIVWFVNHV
jgi:hypothetical protein